MKLDHEVLGRAIADADFRRRLIEDPRATLESIGAKADEETIAKLESMDLAQVEAALAGPGDAAAT